MGIEKATVGQVEGRDGISHVDVYERSFSGREKSRCKGPEVHA